MTARHLMKCGHVAQGMMKGPDGVAHPTCVICYGITPKAVTVRSPSAVFFGWPLTYSKE